MSKNRKRKLLVCWKCRCLVEIPGGFYKRKKSNGPCDRCLGQLTTFQIAMQDIIWVKQLSSRKELDKEKKRKKYFEEQRRKKDGIRGKEVEKRVSGQDSGIPKTDGSKQQH